MTDEPNEALMAKAADLQSAGEQKFGKDNWNAMTGSVGRQGVPGEYIRQIVNSPDALQDFTMLSQEAMLREMQASDNPNDAHARALDESYRAIRAVQKEARGRRR
jgi:hypothetical protein